MITSVSVAPKSSVYPRILVFIEGESGTYRVVETEYGVHGAGHFVVEKREEQPDALGDYDWEPATGEGYGLLGPMAREYYNSVHTF